MSDSIWQLSGCVVSCVSYMMGDSGKIKPKFQCSWVWTCPGHIIIISPDTTLLTAQVQDMH